MYFFKDDSYYLFNGNKLDIDDGYPRLINEKWAFCSLENLRQNMNSSAVAGAFGHASRNRFIAYIAVHAICLLLRIRSQTLSTSMLSFMLF